MISWDESLAGSKKKEGMRRTLADKEGILSPKGIRTWVLFGILFQVMVKCWSGEWLKNGEMLGLSRSPKD